MDQTKAETIRRLIVGDLRRIYRVRYGPTLPNDDAGRDDLELLLMPISLSSKAAPEKMQHAIDTLAPWMPKTEASALIDNLIRLDERYRRPSMKEIGERIRLTNAERERLTAWRITPVDITSEALAEQRKAKERKRKARKRLELGKQTRAEYLAAIKSIKPWEAAGIPRRTWFRRKARGMALGVSATILLTTQEQPSATPTKLNRPMASRGNPGHSLNRNTHRKEKR